jgi:hypothetical protein
MLAAGGSVADGVLTWMCDETYLAEVAFPAVARGAAEAERAVPPVIAGLLICVSDDAERARAALRPRLAPLGGYHSYQAVLSHGAPAPREPVDVAVIGTEGEVATAFGRLAAVGVSELVAVVLPDPPAVQSAAMTACHRRFLIAGQRPGPSSLRCHRTPACLAGPGCAGELVVGSRRSFRLSRP